MTCSLLDYLEREKKLADLRMEVVNSARLEIDIANHKERCVNCAGIGENSLVNNFFAGLNITVLKNNQPT